MKKGFIEKIIPLYARIPLLCVVVLNSAVYWGARAIAQDRKHVCMETVIDKWIPFVPQMVFIYLGCYLFWIVNYILCGQLGKKHAIHFYFSDMFAKVICFFFYILLPTIMDRPDAAGSGISQAIVAWLYKADAADNLFPSIHCLVSWLCYIGIRGKEEIPIIYRRASCVFAILVCISTVTVKQHVIADVIAGVLLAEVSFKVVGRRIKISSL